MASVEALKNSTLYSPDEVSKNALPGLPLEEKNIRLSKKSFSSLRTFTYSSEPFFIRMKLFANGLLSLMTADDEVSAAIFPEETSVEHEENKSAAHKDTNKYFKSVFPS